MVAVNVGLFLLIGDSCETAAVAAAVLGAKALMATVILGEGGWRILLATPTVPLLFLAAGDEDAGDVGDDEAFDACGPPCCHSFTIDATRPGDVDGGPLNPPPALLLLGEEDEAAGDVAGVVVLLFSRTGEEGGEKRAADGLVGDEVTFFRTGAATGAV